MHEPRVLHLSPTYFAQESVLGGAERYVLGLAQAMADAVPTTLLSFGPKPFAREIGKLRFIVRKPFFNADGNKLNPVDLGFLSELLKHDVIHCHQVHTLLTETALVASRAAGKRVYLTDHGGGGRTLLTRFGIYKAASGLLSVSQYAASRSAAAVVPGSVIYGGIDIQKFRPSQVGSRAAKRIVSIGRILPHKGFHHLIEALEVSAELVIAGGATDRSYIECLKELSKGKSVQFIEDPSDEKIVELLQTAQLAVFASTRIGPKGERLSGEPELFGQAPLEAMACGTPALISDVGSYPEIALGGTPDLLFKEGGVSELRSKTASLLRDTTRCQELGTRSREHVLSRFTWPRVVESCLNAYSTG